jgi:hypothetical protein
MRMFSVLSVQLHSKLRALYCLCSFTQNYGRCIDFAAFLSTTSSVLSLQLHSKLRALYCLCSFTQYYGLCIVFGASLSTTGSVLSLQLHSKLRALYYLCSSTQYHELGNHLCSSTQNYELGIIFAAPLNTTGSVLSVQLHSVLRSPVGRGGLEDMAPWFHVHCGGHRALNTHPGRGLQGNT